MSQNFKIRYYRNISNLHLKLNGDMDRNSARKLVSALEKYGHGVDEIFIHTSGLKTIDPFVKTLFQKNTGVVQKQADRLIWTGNHVRELIH